MVGTLSPPQASSGAPVPGRRISPIVVAGAVAASVALLIGAIFVFAHVVEGRPVPSFPSLVTQPDPSLHGTVAYYADQTHCVRMIAASGLSSKDVLCLPAQDPKTAAQLGKEAGPQLVWRADGRLEITMFRMRVGKAPGPAFSAGWQKVVDVRTGQVQDTPAADVPSSPNKATQPAVNAAGRQVTFSSDAPSGRVKVVVTDATGSHTVLSAHGPGEYGYQLTAAFWSPDGSWIAADDGRILVITPGPPPRTRLLIDPSGSASFSGEPGLARFAVTGADLL
jgi:hypothetical protein